jgi:hypothetical protein
MSIVFDIFAFAITNLLDGNSLQLQDVFGRQVHKGVAGAASAGEA